MLGKKLMLYIFLEAFEVQEHNIRIKNKKNFREVRFLYFPEEKNLEWNFYLNLTKF